MVGAVGCVCKCTGVRGHVQAVGGRLYAGVHLCAGVCSVHHSCRQWWCVGVQLTAGVAGVHRFVQVLCAGVRPYTGVCGALSACAQGSHSRETLGAGVKQAPWRVGWSQRPCRSGRTPTLQAGALVPGTGVGQGVARPRGSGRMTRKWESSHSWTRAPGFPGPGRGEGPGLSPRLRLLCR